jgi:hypothetical protein
VSDTSERRPPAPATTWAAFASVAAGAIHASAAGVHGEHGRGAVLAFGLLALVQIGWGVLALVRTDRWVPWLGLAANVPAIGGWLLAKTTGIPLIPGLDAAEPPGVPDTLAALLAVVAVAGAVLALAGGPATMGRGWWAGQVPAAAVVSALLLTGMVATGGHSHGAGHGHDAELAAAGGHDHGDMAGMDHNHDGDPARADHDHDGDPARADHDHTATAAGATTGHDHGATGPTTGHAHPSGTHAHPPGDDDHDHPAGGDAHGHQDPGAPPGGHDHDPGPTDPGGDQGHEHPGGDPTGHPYTATLPVDLSGFPGVTPEQQAAAERLVTDTLVGLPPRFADRDTAVSLGWMPVGDAFTGDEHLVNWALLTDGRVLDPAYPESLVYRVDPITGDRVLEAAMYELELGQTLADVPDVGGPMMQWHVHQDLCWVGEPGQYQVYSTSAPGNPCPPPSFRLESPPMIHVWVVPHPCGPFAALDGVAGGQVPEGEEVLCDHIHGSP